MKSALEHPWFKKFGLKNEEDVNNKMENDNNIKKNNTLKNDFGFYTAAVKKNNL